MSMFDDLLAKAKSLADKNGDGKIDAADLEALKQDLDEEGKKKVGELQKAGDKNGDGKIDLEDLKGLVGDAGNAAGDLAGKAKDAAADLAGKAGNAAKDAAHAAGNTLNDLKNKVAGK